MPSTSPLLGSGLSLLDHCAQQSQECSRACPGSLGTSTWSLSRQRSIGPRGGRLPCLMELRNDEQFRTCRRRRSHQSMRKRCISLPWLPRQEWFWRCSNPLAIYGQNRLVPTVQSAASSLSVVLETVQRIAEIHNRLLLGLPLSSGSAWLWCETARALL